MGMMDCSNGREKDMEGFVKKIVSLACCLILVIGCFAGCVNQGGEDHKDNGEQIVLKIYAQYQDEDTKGPYDYAVKKLAERYPNVKLELIIQAQDDGATLMALADEGMLPDIFKSNSSVISSLKEKNQIMVLDDVAKSTGYLDKLLAANKNLAYESDGHIYAFPYAGNEYALIYYNKNLFTQCNLEIPTTYDELLHCIEVFRENDIIPLELMTEGWVYTSFYDMVLTRYTNAGIVSIDNGSAQITDEDYLKAAKVVEKLAAAGLFQETVTNTSYEEATNAFFNGEAAMFINGQWFITDATDRMGDSVDWMFYPSYDEASYEANKYAFSGGASTSGFSVNPDGEHVELAAEVAEFLTEKYCEYKVLYRGTPLVAIDTGLEKNVAYPAMMQKLVETIPEMTSTTQFAWGLNNTAFYDAITNYSGGLVSGAYSSEKFISILDEEMKKNSN